MALISKVQFLGIDKGGSILTINNNTGVYNAINNPGGYGGANTPVADIAKFIFTFSQYSESDIHAQVYVRTYNPEFPAHLTEPTIEEIAAGAPIEVSSLSLGISPVFIPFRDGVWDINMYTVLSMEKTGVVGVKGNNFIQGSSMNAFSVYDAVAVGDNVYDIDKTRGDDNVIFLVEELQEAVTAFNPVYSANTKNLGDKATEELIIDLVGDAARYDKCNSQKILDLLFQIMMFEWRAERLMAAGDPVGANAYINDAFALGYNTKARV